MSGQPMDWLNRRVRRAGDGVSELALPSGTLAVGDVITGSSGDLPIGVSSCLVALDEIGEEPVIIVRARQTEVVRWEHAPSGGVDSGVFGVWDASQHPSEGKLSDQASYSGLEQVLGRTVFALETGDGGYSCVTGRDASGEVSVVVAGPGVHLKRFGIVSEEAKAEAERLLARPAGPLGEDACPVVSWLVAPLGEAAQAAAAERGVALQGAKDPKKARAQQQKRLALLLGWALRRWRALLVELLPVDAERIGAIVPHGKSKADWAGPVFEIYNYAMSTLRFDLESAFTGPDAGARIAESVAEVTPQHVARSGASSLLEIAAHVDFGRVRALRDEESLPMVMRHIAGALERSLVLHALSMKLKNPARCGPDLDALLDRVDQAESPVALVERL